MLRVETPPGLPDAAVAALRRFVAPPARVLACGTEPPDALAARLRREGYRVSAYAAGDLGAAALPFPPHGAICAVGIDRLENPWRLLRTCAAALTPGGTLLVTAANAASVRNRWRFLVHRDLEPEASTPIHAPTLERAARRAGLELLGDLPHPPGADLPDQPLARLAARLVHPLLHGGKDGADRIYVLRRAE
jgi:hypothetical protein